MATYRYLVTVEDAVADTFDKRDAPFVESVIHDEIQSNLESTYPYASIAVVTVRGALALTAVAPYVPITENYDY